MVELWKPIPTWEGIYEVSTLGRVRSVDRITTTKRGVRTPVRGRVRRHHVQWDGHCSIGLKANGRYEQKLVHALVLSAFVCERPAGAIARHLNGDSEDNRVENLTWGTMSENNYDQVVHGTHPWARRTHCKNGHEFSGRNVRMAGNARICRTCANDAAKRSRLRRLGREVTS